MNSHYLSSSTESARITAAEKQMTPIPEVEYPFDIFPLMKSYRVYLSPPYFFPDISSPIKAKDNNLKLIQIIINLGEGYYQVITAPWSLNDMVAEELQSVLLPF